VPVYSYNCICGNTFDRYCPLEGRNIPAVCDHCGNGASKQFLLAEISIPTSFSFPKSKYDTYETAKLIDTRNELDLKYPNNIKSETFEDTFIKEYKRFK
jgi:hypothetical protein